MNQAIVKGSIQDVASKQNKPIAEAFLDAEAVVIVDTSGTMGMCDASQGRSRYEAACDELRRIQGEMPGKVAVVSFSSDAIFCPSGIPLDQGGGTNMVKALEFALPVDGLLKIIIIGDGEPDDPDATLRTASRFTGKIDCVFVGSEASPGREFMRKLAAMTGGISVTNETKDLDSLGKNVRLLLSAGA